MYVCLCSALTERDVVKRLRDGESIAELKDKTKAGKTCGSCNTHLKQLAGRYGQG